MLERITRPWIIGAILGAVLMVATGVAVAASPSPSTTVWPAKCKTMTCVNRYLNAIHHGNVIRSAQIGTLQTQMVANARAHQANAADHALFKQHLASDDAQFAALQSDITALKAQNTAQATKIAALESFIADLKANVVHLDVSTVTGTDGTVYLVKTPSGSAVTYYMLFEKAGSPIFP